MSKSEIKKCPLRIGSLSSLSANKGIIYDNDSYASNIYLKSWLVIGRKRNLKWTNQKEELTNKIDHVLPLFLLIESRGDSKIKKWRLSHDISLFLCFNGVYIICMNLNNHFRVYLNAIELYGEDVLP